MNREQELYALKQELVEIPDALDDVMIYALSRAKRRNKIHNLLIKPAGAIITTFLIFITAVNISPTAAHAIDNIPGLRELAQAVSFTSLLEAESITPSMRIAAENDYVQDVGLEQTVNEITMKVEYIILDHKQINIFYTLESESYTDVHTVNYKLYNADGIALEYSAWDRVTGIRLMSVRGLPTDEIRQLSFYFDEVTMYGNQIIFMCEIIDLWGHFDEDGYPTPVVEFTFKIDIEPELIHPGEIISMDQLISIDGQQLRITFVEIYPTHTRIIITEEDSNTSRLKSLLCHIVDENGNRFDLTGYNLNMFSNLKFGRPNYIFESSFFTQSENLTLVITQALWLDKNAPLTKGDLINETAQNLPQDVELIRIKELCWCDDEFTLPEVKAQCQNSHVNNSRNWEILFIAPLLDIGFDNPFVDEWMWRLYPVFQQSIAFDTFKNEHDIITWVSDISTTDSATLSYYRLVRTSGYMTSHVLVTHYPHDVIYLIPEFTSFITFDVPLEIVIK